MFFQKIYMKNMPPALINKAIKAIYIIAINSFAECCGRVVAGQDLLRQVLRYVVWVVFAGFAFANSANAACNVIIGTVTASPATVIVGDSVVLKVLITYQGCKDKEVVVKDSNPLPNLTYSGVCLAGNGDWNCANVTTVSGIASSSFTPGNGGNKSSTLSLTYTATSVGTVTVGFTNNISSDSSGSAIVTVQSSLIAEYRFDETSGTTATDSSANNLNGTLNNGVALGRAGKVCGSYKFDGINDYVSVPHSALLNKSKITVMAWVRHSTASIKSWEAIVTKGDSAYRLHLNGGCSINGVNTQGGLSLGINGGCAGADINSGTVPVAATWYHAAGTYDGSAIKIYINGALIASKPYTGTIAINTSPLYIGENAQQGGRYFDGDIDEVKIFSGALTDAQILAGYNNENALPAGKNWDGTTRVCVAAVPDHYELSLPTSGITCLPTTATVTACADNSSPCTNRLTTVAGQTATLATSAGTLATTAVTFNALGVASTTLSYPAGSDGAVATVTLSGEQVAAINARKYCPDGGNCVVGNSTSTTFSTAGFVVSATSTGAAATIPTQVAGTSSGALYLRAIRTPSTTATGACVAALGGTTAVEFSNQCNNPTTCATPSLMSIDGGTVTTIAGNPNSGVSSYTSVPMTFDGNGSAPFKFNYSDAGRVTLFVRKAASGSLFSVMAGASNPFVVRPDRFVLSNIVPTLNGSGRCAVNPNSSPACAVDATGARFVKAGESFSATATAVTSGGTATPNFGREVAPEGVTLSHNLVAPVLTPPVLGTLNNSAAFGAFSEGSAMGTTFNWNEVGMITLSPALTSGNYLGSGVSVLGTPSGNVGRFYPDHFEVSVNSNGALQTACGSSFTYTGQPMGYVSTSRPALTIKPMSAGAGGTLTRNYQGAFMKLVSSGVSITSPTVDTTQLGKDGLAKTALTGTMIASPLDNSNGTMTYTLNAGDQFTYTRNANALLAPYTTALRLIVTTVAEPAIGGDGVAGVTGTLPTLQPTGVSMRYGRARMLNAYGSELLALPIPLVLEFVSPVSSVGVPSWSPNTLDTCSTLSSSNFAFAFAFPAGTVAKPNHLAACETALTVSGASPNQKLILGRPCTGIPCAGNAGWVTLTLNLGALKLAANSQCAAFGGAGADDVPANMPWLLDAAANPRAQATFGIYKSPLIYRRENY